MIYFDHNATSTLLPEARQVWLQTVEQYPGNPSSPHRLGGRAEAVLDRARQELAGFLGCDPFEIVWTSGATESNNTVLHHFAAVLPARTEVLISAIEHPSVQAPARHYFGSRCRWVPVTADGLIDLDSFRGALQRARPGLVAIMAANNETGVLQPWGEVLQLCRQFEVPLLCDAVQWMGRLPADGLGGCDFLSGSAHKFGGPRGVGFLKCAAGGRFRPLLRGGPQEGGRRAGTENVAGVCAMLAALGVRERALAPTGANPGGGRLAELRVDFEKRLLEIMPDAVIIGQNAPRLWNTVMVLAPEADCRRRWVVKLDKLGFAVSTGSACASGKEEPSHVLGALGYSPAEAGRALRFSSGWETTPEQWSSLGQALAEVWRTSRPSSS